MKDTKVEELIFTDKRSYTREVLVTSLFIQEL
jgi:hypothetical protein